MRVGGALRVLCMAATAMVLSDQVFAEGADDDADDIASGAPSLPAWTSLFDLDSGRKPAFDFLTGGMPDRLLYFTGVEMQRWSLGAYAGMQWAPAQLDNDGFILRLLLSNSIERYATPIHRFDTQIGRAFVMPGYAFKRGDLSVQMLAGIDLDAELLVVDRRPTKLRGRLGARFTTDLWWEPTRALLLQYSLSGTMIDNGISMRAAAGWRVFDRFWIGPEVLASSDDYSRQYRIGAHLTGFHTGTYEWSIAAGHVEDSLQRHGIYGRVGVVVRPQRAPFFEN